jgi:RND family efflux transporter MFP subunit
MRRIASLLLAAALLAVLPANAEPPTPATPVTTAPLSDLLISLTWEAPATATALNDTRLSAEIAGRVLTIPVRVGDTVEAGALVAELDCADHQSALARAEAVYLAAVARQEYADARLANAERLAENRSIATEELDQRTVEAKTSPAEVQRTAAERTAAERNVAKCTLRAPFAGVVVERLANVGDYAVVGTPVVRLLDQENIEVSAKVQEQDLASLQIATDLRFLALNRQYPLERRVVIPLLQSVTRSYEARLSFRAEDAAPPGAAGRLTWTDGVGYLPSHLLVRRGDALGVFIAEGDSARFHRVDGAREGQPARVDLPADTELVVDGRYALEDGGRVER